MFKFLLRHSSPPKSDYAPDNLENENIEGQNEAVALSIETADTAKRSLDFDEHKSSPKKLKPTSNESIDLTQTPASSASSSFCDLTLDVPEWMESTKESQGF